MRSICVSRRVKHSSNALWDLTTFSKKATLRFSWHMWISWEKWWTTSPGWDVNSKYTSNYIIGRCARPKHWVSYAICAFSDCWAHPRKPQILLSIHQKVPSHSFPYRLRVAWEEYTPQRHSRNSFSDLLELFETRKTSQQILDDKYSQNIASRKLFTDRRNFHDESVQSCDLQPCCQGGCFLDSRVHQIQDTWNFGTLYRKKPDWTFHCEAENGYGVARKRQPGEQDYVPVNSLINPINQSLSYF